MKELHTLMAAAAALAGDFAGNMMGIFEHNGYGKGDYIAQEHTRRMDELIRKAKERNAGVSAALNEQIAG